MKGNTHSCALFNFTQNNNNPSTEEHPAPYDTKADEPCIQSHATTKAAAAEAARLCYF